MSDLRTRRRVRVVAALAGVGGAALFVWSIRQAGASAVFDGVRRVGVGFVVVFALGGVRGLIRTTAWRVCLDREDQPTLRSIFAAYLAGDAIGNVTPFGFLISEPSKIVLVRPQIAVQASVAALTTENLFYSVTVAVMLIAGAAALLLSFAVPRPLAIAAEALLVGTLLTALAAIWIVTTRRRIVSGAAEWLVRHGVAERFLAERLPHVRHTGDRIFGFVARRPNAVLPVILLEIAYHIAAVIEIWFALSLITGVPPPLLTAFVLEAVNRTITIAFQFVPMWLGVDEAGTALLTNALALGPATGVSLALVRKARVGLWTAIGLAILLHRGLSIGTAAREADVLATSD